eukprot:1724493-Rhodomonas_salina.1
MHATLLPSLLTPSSLMHAAAPDALDARDALAATTLPPLPAPPPAPLHVPLCLLRLLPGSLGIYTQT